MKLSAKELKAIGWFMIDQTAEADAVESTKNVLPKYVR